MFGGLFKKKDNKMILGAPVKGKAVPLSEVNDPTFAEEMLGKGMAVIPAEGKIYPTMIRMARRYNDPSIIADLIHSMQSALYLKKGQRF